MDSEMTNILMCPSAIRILLLVAFIAPVSSEDEFGDEFSLPDMPAMSDMFAREAQADNAREAKFDRMYSKFMQGFKSGFNSVTSSRSLPRYEEIYNPKQGVMRSGFGRQSSRDESADGMDGSFGYEHVYSYGNPDKYGDDRFMEEPREHAHSRQKKRGRSLFSDEPPNEHHRYSHSNDNNKAQDMFRKLTSSHDKRGDDHWVTDLVKSRPFLEVLEPRDRRRSSASTPGVFSSSLHYDHNKEQLKGMNWLGMGGSPTIHPTHKHKRQSNFKENEIYANTNSAHDVSRYGENDRHFENNLKGRHFDPVEHYKHYKDKYNPARRHYENDYADRHNGYGNNHGDSDYRKSDTRTKHHHHYYNPIANHPPSIKQRAPNFHNFLNLHNQAARQYANHNEGVTNPDDHQHHNHQDKNWNKSWENFEKGVPHHNPNERAWQPRYVQNMLGNRHQPRTFSNGNNNMYARQYNRPVYPQNRNPHYPQQPHPPHSTTTNTHRQHNPPYVSYEETENLGEGEAPMQLESAESDFGEYLTDILNPNYAKSPYMEDQL